MTTRTASLIISSIALNVVGAVLLFPMLTERIGGRRYNPSQPQDLSALRRIIYSAKPLQAALEEHHQQHRSYPDQLDVLGSKLKEKHYLDEMVTSGVVPRITSVRPEGNGYQIYIKLGWDPGLYYHSSENEWTYDPGDGSETTVIEP